MFNNFNMFNMNQNNNMGFMNNIGGAPQMNIFGNKFININNKFNNMKNIEPPINGIKNYSSPVESSYANSVLQSLACLDCIKKWYYQLIGFNFNNINITQSSITKLFFNLLFNLYSGKNVDSYYIINQYYQEVFQVFRKNPKIDSFHFLFYFLDLLHFENNYISNSSVGNFNKPDKKCMQNDSYMFNLFQMFFKSTQNSVISTYFFNILKYEFRCTNPFLKCPSLYKYQLRKIIQFDVDNYKKYRDKARPYRMGKNLNLEECFMCFFGGYDIQCKNCGNFKAKTFSSLLYSTQVLIISFKRNYHSFKCDIDFGTRINISNFCKNNMHGFTNNNYILKACISLYNYQKYFADIFINGNWFRFIDNNYKVLDRTKNEIYNYEPELLIYELENTQNSTNINNFNINNGFSNNNNMMINNGFKNNFFSQINQLLYRNWLINLGKFHLMMRNLNLMKGF